MTNLKSTIVTTSSVQDEHLKPLLFGRRLMRERKRLGLTQKEAADRCGVRREMWGRYERDEAQPGVGLLEQFCAIGARPGALLVGRAIAMEDESAELLAEVAAQLGLSNQFHELAPIVAKMQGEKRDFFDELDRGGETERAGGSDLRASELVRRWLGKSEHVVFPRDWDALASAIEAADFAARAAERSVDPHDLVDAIRALWIKTKQANRDTVSIPDFANLIDQIKGITH